eukprot:2852821-Karenia_brevis.AAC.1
MRLKSHSFNQQDKILERPWSRLPRKRPSCPKGPTAGANAPVKCVLASIPSKQRDRANGSTKRTIAPNSSHAT